MMGAPDQPGIIPRLCGSLFDRIARIENKRGEASEAKVEGSYMEIYNEKVFALLALTSTPKAGLKVRAHNVLGPYVDGLGQLAVISFQVKTNPRESRSRRVRRREKPFLAQKGYGWHFCVCVKTVFS